MEKPNELGSNGCRCITRRNLLRASLGIAGFGALTAADLALLKPIEAAALDLPVTFVKGTRLDYYGGFTNEFRVNGNIGFCCNPEDYSPPTGQYGEVHDDPLWSSPAPAMRPDIGYGNLLRQIRQAMYLGVDGPGYTREFFPDRWYDGSELVVGHMIICQHILLADIWSLQGSYALAGVTDDGFRQWAYTNITGFPGEMHDLTVGSMRYHVTYAAEDYATNKDGDADRFPQAPDAFKVYVMNAGLDHEHGGGRNYQRIIFAEPMTNVPVTKSWAGDSGHEDMRPDAITVTLRGPTGYEESTQLTAAGGWRGEFAITPAGGLYTLTEENVPGYTSSVSGSADIGFVVTNTLRTIEVSVRKVWDDDGATERRPASVAVTLRGSDGTARQATLSDTNSWAHTWTGLPEVDENGDEVVYTVEEEAVEDYDGSVAGSAGSGFMITNTLRTGYGTALKAASEESWL